jgi:hypothetical protein
VEKAGVESAEVGFPFTRLGSKWNEVGFQSAEALFQSAACLLRLAAVHRPEIVCLLPSFADGQPATVVRRPSMRIRRFIFLTWLIVRVATW